MIKEKGVTLLELLIVVIIVGILAAVGISQYRKIAPKAKASKAKHALALIAEAEKMYKLDYGVYWAVAEGAVDAGIGTTATGMNLIAVDKDIDFKYSVNTITGKINARNPAAIGTCGINTPITQELDTGEVDVPACYE